MKNKMKITLAKHSGFCFGVKRALEKTFNEKSSNIYTLGPLIHNPQVIEQLNNKGIKIISSIDNINSGTIIIRTHGVPDKIIEKAKNKGLKIIDLTCPFVKKAQDKAKQLEKQGYKVIVIGEKKHPEVESIAANIKDSTIIEKPEQIKDIKKHNRIGVISQTTQSKENFENIINKLKKQANELKIENTICNATIQRQEAAKQLAEEVDLMLVIGGYSSANTKQLAALCSKITETKHIETEKELKKEWFISKSHVGIIAGASTPDWVVEGVIRKLHNITP